MLKVKRRKTMFSHLPENEQKIIQSDILETEEYLDQLEIEYEYDQRLPALRFWR